MLEVKLRVTDNEAIPMRVVTGGGGGGRDGYSPTVDLTRLDNGVRIDVRDARGLHTATVYDGTAGVLLDVGIDARGHLIYSCSGDSPVDFEIVDGHLILEVV